MKIGMVLFDGVTILDFIGPYEVFQQVDGWEVFPIGFRKGNITCHGGLKVHIEFQLSEMNDLDIFFVPGGFGVNDVMQNSKFIEEIFRLAKSSKYITSVCTGSLILACAGLLKNKKATSHWRSLDLLAKFGSIPTKERVVVDGNCITGAGVTSGIDFALTLVKQLKGETYAKELELWIEYDPEPPMKSGNPSSWTKQSISPILEKTKAAREFREKLIDQLTGTS
ncbi:DJ-1/PfpI family protein [Leptospira sp. 96542]|nr:DJ-1/PfpI family protein [Leptospira sp. 96542]